MLYNDFSSTLQDLFMHATKRG